MTVPESRRHNEVRVLPLAAGGCGACAQSVQALLAPRYVGQLAAQRVSFVESPRHADIVLVTGALVAAERDGIERVVEAVAQPRVLIAAGNCAIDGCVFAGSPSIVPSTAEALDVHVQIGGCPPAPETILVALAEAAALLAEADGNTGADETTADETEGEGRDA
jgi:Ni,Fe-hydrogenase III small subunit